MIYRISAKNYRSSSNNNCTEYRIFVLITKYSYVYILGVNYIITVIQVFINYLRYPVNLKEYHLFKVAKLNS